MEPSFSKSLILAIEEVDHLILGSIQVDFVLGRVVGRVRETAAGFVAHGLGLAWQFRFLELGLIGWHCLRCFSLSFINSIALAL